MQNKHVALSATASSCTMFSLPAVNSSFSRSRRNRKEGLFF